MIGTSTSKLLLDRPYFFSIEGNIGAGKSTLSRVLEKQYGYSIVFEPVQNNDEVPNHKNLLEAFYHDPKRWCFTLQSSILIARAQKCLQALEAAKPGDIVITDRSIYGDYYCFALKAYKSGLMSKMEWGVYDALFSSITANKKLIPDGTMYLRVDVKTCKQRIRMRHRAGEEGISLAYLKEIEVAHDSWLIAPKDQSMPLMVIESGRNQPHYAADIPLLYDIKKFIGKVVSGPDLVPATTKQVHSLAC